MNKFVAFAGGVFGAPKGHRWPDAYFDKAVKQAAALAICFEKAGLPERKGCDVIETLYTLAGPAHIPPSNSAAMMRLLSNADVFTSINPDIRQKMLDAIA